MTECSYKLYKVTSFRGTQTWTPFGDSSVCCHVNHFQIFVAYEKASCLIIVIHNLFMKFLYIFHVLVARLLFEDSYILPHNVTHESCPPNYCNIKEVSVVKKQYLNATHTCLLVCPPARATSFPFQSEWCSQIWCPPIQVFLFKIKVMFTDVHRKIRRMLYSVDCCLHFVQLFSHSVVWGLNLL